MPIISVWGLLRPTPTLQQPRQTGQPPSSRCTVHGQGLESLGGNFIGVGLGASTVEPLPSKTDCIKVSYMRSSYLFVTIQKTSNDFYAA